VRLLLCDVDGVLTDGTVTMGDGHEFKRFNIQDGLGLRLLQKQGIRVGWVSARPSPVTRQRADDLKVDFLHQDQGSKVTAVEAILKRAGLRWEETGFVGDDVVDLGALKRAGLAVAVANAIDEAKALAHYVTRAAGGQGAVREIATLILKAQGKWTPLVKEFSA
jgi:3-deoxy-D-manno-octulosonate 8-phosphate phosphatase (KDO 8-P phosphatase)